MVGECHHAASETIVDILQEANAKYVYGVTATPFRGDGWKKLYAPWTNSLSIHFKRQGKGAWD